MNRTPNKSDKVANGFCISGSSLLLIMAVFHGSGYDYVNSSILQSNAEGFLKEIVPVLFAHPSIHLIGLASFGILAIFMEEDNWKVLTLTSVYVSFDALLTLFLGGVIPGLLLTVAALTFMAAAYNGARARYQY